MVRLNPMPEAYYPRFVEEAVADYASDTVRSGRWTQAEAARNSLAELERFLPLGIKTPGHRVCLVTREASDEVVGTLWFGAMTRDGVPVAYVFDIRIYPEHRRRGYAAAALAHVEAHARDLKLASVMLHVFAHNVAAQALYGKLGFTSAGGLMAKALSN